ncbi:MAG: C40 family peptidase [Nocardioidaceae bacterium]
MSAPHPVPCGTVLEVAVPVATVWSSPQSPRDLDAAAVRDLPDVAGWAAAMDAPVRRGLHGRTETQLLLGEPVEVVEVDGADGAWSRVAAPWQRSARFPDGYPGWVRSAHLAAPVPGTEGPSAFVADRSATCTLEDGGGLEVSFGTALRVESAGHDAVTVALPGDRRGTLPRAALRLAGPAEQPSYDGGVLLETAGMFLGLRYLWGGSSTWGLDCSGLVHLVLRSRGELLPRDACDQVLSPKVAPVPLDDVQPGDLYFFARPGQRVYHVGFVSRPVGADGVRWMLHAPEGGELIEDAPLAPHRAETLVSAGRVVPGR